jgi:hypothetical protein
MCLFSPYTGLVHLYELILMFCYVSVLALHRYLPLFERMTLHDVVAMDEAQLKAAGLTLFGPRRKVSYAAQLWRERMSSSSSQTTGGDDALGASGRWQKLS